MNTFQWIFPISMLFMVNAQWYINRKHYHKNLMNYPNPGKRSLSKEKTSPMENVCEMPPSKLYSYQQIITWILMCHQTKSVIKLNDNLLSSRLNNVKVELTSRAKFLPYKKRTSHAAMPYMKSHDYTFGKTFKTLLHIK